MFKIDFKKVLSVVKHVMAGIEAIKTPEFSEKIDVVKQESIDAKEQAKETMIAAKNVAQFLLDSFGVNADLFREVHKNARAMTTDFEEDVFDALE